MAMDDAQTTPPLPADYYRRHAARVRRLADEATTPALKEHLREWPGNTKDWRSASTAPALSIMAPAGGIRR